MARTRDAPADADPRRAEKLHPALVEPARGVPGALPGMDAPRAGRVRRPVAEPPARRVPRPRHGPVPASSVSDRGEQHSDDEKRSGDTLQRPWFPDWRVATSDTDRLAGTLARCGSCGESLMRGLLRLSVTVCGGSQDVRKRPLTEQPSLFSGDRFAAQPCARTVNACKPAGSPVALVQQFESARRLSAPCLQGFCVRLSEWFIGRPSLRRVLAQRFSSGRAGCGRRARWTQATRGPGSL